CLHPRRHPHRSTSTSAPGVTPTTATGMGIRVMDITHTITTATVIILMDTVAASSLATVTATMVTGDATLDATGVGGIIRACTHKRTAKVLTWMCRPTSVIGGKADMARAETVSVCQEPSGRSSKIT